uniref:Uncharacterized protein n=1 Tax=Entomoneis paludosa TaxID=265537 RepID=A0A7S2YAG4_9STRA|mmetsp:Transcript_24511/g.50986  ORF Transcript_24511/g.50986 Transcript_24511/m.50986 type:complete len:532 (+) Transcript_24511:817-2412(+)|eukprot:CAMPEP_0172448290 /NCGR_PEP_ID=MMETSP1065-20121228/7336_1 /TAXON_ID=265537 /ORGANISM="Amphiprora paludosa, Strain CCMP125" /LENGTH=531 /DNA_ID=CAMNT_0013199745 /DNA_START=808 /DNA_END=2403 /DNA_ORIENTATION=+
MDKGDTVLVPERMSVGELRQWLSQFGENNREHFKKNQVQKIRHNALQKRIHQLEQAISSTSSTASSSRDEHRDTTEDEASMLCEGEEVPLVESSSSQEPGLTYSQDDSIFRSLDLSEKEASIEETPHEEEDDFASLLVGETPPTVPTESIDNPKEDYKIVSIRKLLEAPKPTPRRSHGTSWEELLEDDFSDSFSRSHHSSSLVWQGNASRKQGLNRLGQNDAHSDCHYDESSSAPGGSTSSVLTGLRKTTGNDDETDSLSTKSRSSTLSRSSRGSFRSRLPMLLCKPPRDEDSKLVQRTFNNGRKGSMLTQQRPHSSSFRPVSPHPVYYSSGLSEGRATINELPSLFDSLTDDMPRRRNRHEERDESTVSCPDFAAATAYLHHYSARKASDSVPDERLDERTSRRERRKYRSTSRKAEQQYGTSAILPDAVDASLGRVFAMEESAYMAKASMNSDYHKPPRQETSRISDKVSKFGGSGRRPSSVQRRQEELQKQWAANRSVQHVKKVKWQVCNSSGSYKKKIVVDKEITEE